MSTITYTRPAKCDDCKFCKSFYNGKQKRHTCTNPVSPQHTAIITLKDLVCDKWELI